MDRPIIYTQEQGRSVDFLFGMRAAMIGLAKLSSTCLGANTTVRGLAVTPNSPAALNVLVGIGEIYSVEEVDATQWGSLPADTTDLILKQGLNMAAQTISTPAPATSGYSVCYLIEAQYQDQDTNSAVLPYYNSSNPQQPLNGEGGLGATQATERQGVCVIQAKAGIAAPTGTQVAPSVDSGWTALAVVTVAYGQTTVASGNITIPAGVPQVTNLLQMMQTGSTEYAIDTSSIANAIAISLTPPITAYTDGERLRFQAANTNTSAATINAGPGSITLAGAAGALQGGEIVAGKYYEAVYKANTGTAILVAQGGGAVQVNPATQPEHAAQMGQIQTQAGTAFTTGGTAPAFTLTPSPAITALAANQRFRVKFNAAGTLGSNTLNISGLGAVALMQYDSNGSLQAANITNGLLTDVEYNGTYMVVLDPVQVSTGVIGSTRNLVESLTAAGTSLSYTADEIIVGTGLGGMSYVLGSFSKTINISGTGAGGMDTGSAPTSGYVAIYAIYNPTTGASALLGTNATSAAAPSVYGGANPVSGYTASALIGLWPTNSSSQFVIGNQIDRSVGIIPATALNSSSIVASLASLSISSIIPKGAKSIRGYVLISNSTANVTTTVVLAESLPGAGQKNFAETNPAASTGFNVSFDSLSISVAQTLYYATASTGGTPSFGIAISGYTF